MTDGYETLMRSVIGGAGGAQGYDIEAEDALAPAAGAVAQLRPHLAGRSMAAPEDAFAI
jgi:hypothetical protein